MCAILFNYSFPFADKISILEFRVSIIHKSKTSLICLTLTIDIPSYSQKLSFQFDSGINTLVAPAFLAANIFALTPATY